MTKPNLVTALAAALDSSPGSGTPPDAVPKIAEHPSGDTLLSALRNSATGRDQIMQRRLGTLPETPV